MTDGDLAYAPMTEVSRLLDAREVTSEELTRLALARIARYDGRLNAWATVLEERALADARDADAEIAAGRRRGPLHGVPYGAKDLFDTAGVRTAAGSPILDANVPDVDATVVARLAAAGMVMLGKTQMLEFAYGSPHPAVGPTANPWDVTRTAAGSSGGSAAAVAAGMAYVALGTDTAGSIRIPAAWTGLIGLKPTRGRVSLAGVVPLAYSMDNVGPMARTARDAALMLAAIAGADDRDPWSVDAPVADYVAEMDAAPRAVRVGVDRAAIEAVATPEVGAAALAMVDALADAGATVVPVTLPAPPRVSWATGVTIGVEAAHFHRRWLEERPHDYSAAVRRRLEQGLATPGTDYVEAQRVRMATRVGYLELLRDVDVIATPTTVIPAMPLADVLEEVAHPSGDPVGARTRFTAPVNGVGLPAVSAPAGWSDGVPLGAQLIGAPFAEGLLLGLAERVAGDGLGRRPPLD